MQVLLPNDGPHRALLDTTRLDGDAGMTEGAEPLEDIFARALDDFTTVSWLHFPNLGWQPLSQ